MSNSKSQLFHGFRIAALDFFETVVNILSKSIFIERDIYRNHSRIEKAHSLRKENGSVCFPGRI